MKVYVLETGVYEDRSIHGIYTTLEAAMAAWQPTPPTAPMYIAPPSRTIDMATGRVMVNPGGPVFSRFTYTWSTTPTEWGWEFDADFDDAASIAEYEVMDSGPVFTTRVTQNCIGTCGHKIIKGCEAISAPHGLFCSPDCADNGGIP